MPTTESLLEPAVPLRLEPWRLEHLSATVDALPPIVEGQHTSEGDPIRCFEDILAVEDVLSECGAFKSMFDGRRASAAAYGTILDFAVLEVAMQLIGRDRFNRTQWRAVIGYWRHNWNLSPILGLLAATFARQVGLPSPLERDQATDTLYAPGRS